MTITYQNNFRDRLAFLFYHFMHSRFAICIAAGFILFMTWLDIVPAVREDRSHPLLAKMIGFSITEILLIVMTLGGWALIIFATVAANSISKKNKPLTAERTLTLTEEFFGVKSAYGQSETKWNSVQKLARTSKHILIYVNAQAAVIVPRRAFRDSQQWDEFYSFCEQKTGRGV
jgi:YcxB-like protein